MEITLGKNTLNIRNKSLEEVMSFNITERLQK